MDIMVQISAEMATDVLSSDVNEFLVDPDFRQNFPDLS